MALSLLSIKTRPSASFLNRGLTLHISRGNPSGSFFVESLVGTHDKKSENNLFSRGSQPDGQ